eukprot:Selendium_serpulae@DN6049_c0_g1_i10.p1
MGAARPGPLAWEELVKQSLLSIVALYAFGCILETFVYLAIAFERRIVLSWYRYFALGVCFFSQFVPFGFFVVAARHWDTILAGRIERNKPDGRAASKLIFDNLFTDEPFPPQVVIRKCLIRSVRHSQTEAGTHHRNFDFCVQHLLWF